MTSRRVTALWDREPVAILAIVQAAIAVAVAFGLDLTSEQVGAVVGLSSVLLGVGARRQVVPKSGATGPTSFVDGP